MLGLWEMCIGIGSLGVLTVLATVLRRKLKVRVNCWFCNEYSLVDFKNRKWWLCGACEQYNGFSQSGDYNYEIPEQKSERLNPILRGRNWLKREPQHDFTATLGPENGLCKICNENQALKVRLLANFVPSSDDKFDSEIESYKSKLEKVYGLCSNCQMTVRRRLNKQCRDLGIHGPTTPTPSKNPSHSTADHGNRRVTPGNLARACHVMGIFLALFLWVSALHSLQEDSQNEIVPLSHYLPVFVMNHLPSVYSGGKWLSSLGLFAQVASMLFGKARLMFLDILVLVAWTGLMLVHFSSVWWTPGMKADCLMWQSGLASSCLFLAFAVALLPRKRIRKTKSQIRSCFSLSVASTPSSQVSQLNGSVHSEHSFSSESGSPSKSQPFPQKSSSQFGSSFFDKANCSEFCEILEPRRFQKSPRAAGGRDSVVRRSPRLSAAGVQTEGERQRKELTPSRILGSQLSGLSLGQREDGQELRRRGPFSSLRFPAAALDRQHDNLFTPPSSPNQNGSTGSILAPPRLNFGIDRSGSGFTNTFFDNSALRRGHSHWGREGDSQSVASWMTSVSQRRMNGADGRSDVTMSGLTSGQSSTGDRCWKVIILVVLLASLGTNALVVYFLMNKTQ